MDRNSRGGHGSRARGYVLIAFSLALLLIIGSVGLSFDIGRMYIVREEAQSFCDAAAIAAALKLDGTSYGISEARKAALKTIKGWNFGTTPFRAEATQVEFATSLAGPWLANPTTGLENYTFARVTTRVELPIFLMPVLTGAYNSSIAATATARQMKQSGMRDLFPYSPYAHPNEYTPDAPVATGCDPGGCLTPEACSTTACDVSPGGADEPLQTAAIRPNPPDPFGMIPAVIRYTDGDGRERHHLRHGGVYTLQWAAAGALHNPLRPSDITSGQLCPGDADNLSVGIGTFFPQFHGYIWGQDSSSVITDAILGDSQGRTLTDEQLLNPVDTVTGNKEAINKALNTRVSWDWDPDSRWYKDYYLKRQAAVAAGQLPDMWVADWRVVTVPVNIGQCSAFGADCTYVVDGKTVSGDYRIVGFAKFFLQTEYDISGVKTACAEYIGTETVVGGAGGVGPGVYVVRLVQ